MRVNFVGKLLPMLCCCLTEFLARSFVTNATINYKSMKEQQIIRELLKGYDANVIPNAFMKPVKPGAATPVVVSINMNILSLSSFNDVTMTFTAQFRFQQEWIDPRLRFHDDYFQPEDCLILAEDQKIWLPDTFFQNEQYGHNHEIDQPNEFVKIKANGLVKYSKRLTMNFSCPMNLLLFPHDTQTCSIEFSSYAYTTNDIMYEWDPIRPLDVIQSAVDCMPKFRIGNVSNTTCHSKTATGQYSCLGVTLVLKREFSYFLLQLYLPSCMMVAVGCVSFWIDWRSAPARVPLAIVTLLTITTQSAGINASLPPVSYTKAIDVWIGACIVFIFGALLEFAIVNYVGTNEQKRRVNFVKRKAKKRINCTVRRSIDMDQCHCECSPPAYSNGDVVPRNRLYTRAQSFRRKLTTSRWWPYGSSSKYDKSILNEASSDEEGDGDCFNAQEYVAYRKKIDDDMENETLLEQVKNSANACRAEKIDTISRVLFPVGFVCFNIVYWALYIPKMSA